MNRQKLGKIVVSVALVLSALISTIVDLSGGDLAHVHNPDWHPHAVFHDIVMFLFLDFMTVVCLWLIWRKTKEPGLGIKVGTLTMIGFWSPFYYVTTIFPMASLASTPDDISKGALLVSWFPLPLYINVMIGTFLLALTLTGHFLYRRGEFHHNA